ncbi:BEN domain-containing protein 2 isoform X2 [Notamacropus eugenii]|uniref:BEN domain-containing protein 2 isoform X2 n=1 Tax=Notamacropus eugenii TaxID=9315 RepID=UPI003B66B319
MSKEQGGEHLSVLGNQVKHPLEIKRNGHNTEETEFLILQKRRRVASSVEYNTMSAQEPDYEDSGSVVYEYEPDYECGSVVSEASYTGHYQKTLMEVLNYCQAMYDAIQKLDKKFDLLHGKVSEMQRTRMKPLLLKPLVNTVVENATSAARSSPALTAAVPTKPEACLGRSTVMMGYPSSQENASLSQEVLSSSICINPSFEYLGDPKRNVKVLGTYLMKARQKTKPKYAARYLVRVLFPKETLLCNVMGISARGRSTLDPNKVAAIREFLATHFPNYDLSEYGRDWKTCITNVNAMIRCLCCETKIKPEKTENKDKFPVTPDSAVCVGLNYNDKDGEVNSQVSLKMTALGTNGIQSSTWDSNSLPEVFQAPSSKKLPSLEPMQLLGYPWRNVQLPFSVIYVAKGKSRPELSARYLIRHLFTEEVLVKSNVYGSLERGMCPLDCNRIHALRDFLQENYPSYDLTETGYDWKACVAAINSTIRSLRHDHKKATAGIRRRTPGKEKNHS